MKIYPSYAMSLNAPHNTGLIESFLFERRPEILAAWGRLLSKWLQSENLPPSRRKHEMVAQIFDRFVEILQDPSGGRSYSEAETASAVSTLATTAGASLPGFVQFVCRCGDDLQRRLRQAPRFATLTSAQQKRLTKEIDVACSILVHREAHAFAEHCGSMLRDIETPHWLIANPFVRFASEPSGQTWHFRNNANASAQASE